MDFTQEFENRTSEARDHLANERTFLAWIRTALGIIGLGVIVGRFMETAGPVAETVGLGLIILGATMVGYAVVRFHRVGALLAEGRYQTSALGPLLIGLVAAVACIGSVILVLLAA